MKLGPDGPRTEASVSERDIRNIGLSPYSSAIYRGSAAVARVRSDARRPSGRPYRAKSGRNLVKSPRGNLKKPKTGQDLVKVDFRIPRRHNPRRVRFAPGFDG